MFALLALLTSASLHAEEAQISIEPERQILVLLRQAPAHYRADSTYGGSYGDGMSQAARERIGRRIARDNDIEFVGSWPMPVIELDCLIMAAHDAQSTAAAAAQIARDPTVEWAEPVRLYKAMGSAAAYNDPLFTVAPAARQWHLAELHKMATGKGVTIAVIDTRIEANHPDLVGQVKIDQNFVTGRPAGAEQHGTGVAGVIAAKANNHVGMVGVAPQARLMGLRACWQLPGATGSACDSLSLAKALHFAIERGAHIINMSLSGPPNRLLGRLIDVGLLRGAVIVASVNSGDASGGFPASHKGVIAVSDNPTAVAPIGVVAAPGSGIPTTQPGAKWYLVNGSSYSAAHVSGLFALMRERQASARSLVPLSDGTMVVDARASLLQAVKSCDRQCAQTRMARLER